MFLHLECQLKLLNTKTVKMQYLLGEYTNLNVIIIKKKISKKAKI